MKATNASKQANKRAGEPLHTMAQGKDNKHKAHPGKQTEPGPRLWVQMMVTRWTTRITLYKAIRPGLFVEFRIHLELFGLQ